MQESDWTIKIMMEIHDMHHFVFNDSYWLEKSNARILLGNNQDGKQW